MEESQNNFYIDCATNKKKTLRLAMSFEILNENL